MKVINLKQWKVIANNFYSFVKMVLMIQKCSMEKSKFRYRRKPKEKLRRIYVLRKWRKWSIFRAWEKVVRLQIFILPKPTSLNLKPASPSTPIQSWKSTTYFQSGAEENPEELSAKTRPKSLSRKTFSKLH